MNLFQLSVRCLYRKRVRSILLFLIVFVAAIFIYSGWACQSASVQTQNSSRQSVGASFRLEANASFRHKQIDALNTELDKKVGENMPGNLGGYYREQLESGEWMTWTDNSFETLKRSDIEKIAQTEGLCAYNITTANTVVNPVNFTRIEDKDRDQTSDQQGVSLRGSRDMAYDFDVQKGNIIVKEGRMVVAGDENVCVISRELAEQNKLQLGDKLEFNDWKERDDSAVYCAKIIGIYDSIQKITPITEGDSYRAENIIFTDLSFPEKAQGCENNPLYQTATFWVEDVDDYEAVKQALVKTEIDWEQYDLLDNSGMSDTMAENFSGLKSMSLMLLCLVFVSSIFILLFVFLFWIKNRICEIGILLSVGRRKLDIILQMLTEGMIVSVAAFMLATCVAPYVAGVTADYLVGNQMELAREKEEAQKGMVSVSEDSGEDEIVGVTVSIAGDVIAATAVSVMGIIVVSIGLSSLSIAIQKPKNILSKM